LEERRILHNFRPQLAPSTSQSAGPIKTRCFRAHLPIHFSAHLLLSQHLRLTQQHSTPQQTSLAMSDSSQSTDGPATPSFRRACMGQISFGKSSFATAAMPTAALPTQSQTETPASSQITIKLPGDQVAKIVPFGPSQSSNPGSSTLTTCPVNDALAGSQNRSTGVLQQMFETGRYSDLTIIAEDGKEFQVHRSVSVLENYLLALAWWFS